MFAILHIYLDHLRSSNCATIICLFIGLKPPVKPTKKANMLHNKLEDPGT